MPGAAGRRLNRDRPDGAEGGAGGPAPAGKAPDWLATAAGFLAGAGLAAAVGFLFYKSWLASCLLVPFGWLTVPGFRSWLAARRRRDITAQFRQFLYAFSTSLAAGRSVENALLAAERDMRMIDPAGRTLLIRELAAMNGQIRNGMSAERAFARFAERLAIGEAGEFAAGFSLCKQAGGDLVELVRRSAALIGEKIEIGQELEAITAQKRFEAKAMAAVPFAMIGFLAFGSPDYMAPMYEGVGRLLMTGVLLLLAACQYWIARLMRLEV